MSAVVASCLFLVLCFLLPFSYRLSSAQQAAEKTIASLRTINKMLEERLKAAKSAAPAKEAEVARLKEQGRLAELYRPSNTPLT